jgi:Protein of unknown function (DUF4199)
MRKIVLVYGVIAGVIVSAMFFITAPLWDTGVITFDNGMFVGYATMVVALSLVFFGVKSYRDNQQHGKITFGRAFKVGILITLIASVIYALSWEVAIRTVSKGFSEEIQKHYAENIKKEAKENGKSEAEVQAKLEGMRKEFELYENPIIRFGYTIVEILPVGLIITTLTALLLRKRDFLPPTEPASQL